MSFIKGNYRQTIFRSNNGYLIALFKVKETSEELKKFDNKTITITGYCPDLNEIDTYKLEGEVTVHPKYGEQFMVQSFERILPTEDNAMISILSSDMFKGIGKKTAEKIVNTLKEDTFDIILHHPSNLLLISGITEKQVNILHQALMSYQGSYEVILKLTSLGFTTRLAMKIYNHYKEATLSVLNDDIYQFYYDLDEISFSLVDHIAGNMMEKNDLKRIEAHIIYVLRTLCTTYGHTYFIKEEIFPYVKRILHFELTEEEEKIALKELEEKELLKELNDKIYLKEYYDAEIFIARRLRLLAHSKATKVDHVNEMIKEIEEKNSITYNEEQKEALKKALSCYTLVITGGPGTGKTTILKGILELYQTVYKDKNLIDKLVLLAPTGRASKRMSETTNYPASTIHRFLKWNKETDRFQINEYNKSKAEVVIIDEASMLDCLLLKSLLSGLSTNCRVIFVGDANQLPAVGAGNVLDDMITSEEIDVISLKNLYRQGKDSHIVTLANNINQGIIDFSIFDNQSDLSFIECSSEDLFTHLKEVILQNEYSDYQVLAPMYKTVYGIDAMNLFLQDLLNGKSARKKEITVGDKTYREGDKVIQLTNLPDENVFNGDIGIISRMKTLGKQEIYIDFDDHEVKYTKSMLSMFNHAYAISIHKSQGSEFDMVIIPVVMAYHKMLYRKLIYTAVTRSKKKLVFIGNKKALEVAILNNKENKRQTTLAYFLKNGIL